MVSYKNQDLIPPFSERFQRLAEEWKTIQSNINHMYKTSAFTSSTSNTFEESSRVPFIVYSCQELLDALEPACLFFETYATELREELADYLEKHRKFIWFDEAMRKLYHPSEKEKKEFAFFQEGTWNGYDLSYNAYIADKERREARGKTSNPNYISTHECCRNCICFWDDTPDYEWAKEDKEECAASNNIRINSRKCQEFEREFLASSTLDAVYNPSWIPPITDQFDGRLDGVCRMKYIADVFQCTLAVKWAANYMGNVIWALPSELDFMVLWNIQPYGHRIADAYQSTRRHILDHYATQKEEEDNVLAAAKCKIKVFKLENCYLEH